MGIFAVSLLSPLRKGWGPSFKKLESPSSKDSLCQVWLKWAQWFQKMKIWKVYDMPTTTMDNVQILIRQHHLILWLRWAQKNVHKIPKSSNENLVIHTMYHSCKMTPKRCPWATLLTWETSSNQWRHLSRVLFTSIYIIKLAQCFRQRFLNFLSVSCNYLPVILPF